MWADVNKAKLRAGDRLRCQPPDIGTIGLSVTAVFINEKFAKSGQKMAGRGGYRISTGKQNISRRKLITKKVQGSVRGCLVIVKRRRGDRTITSGALFECV